MITNSMMKFFTIIAATADFMVPTDSARLFKALLGTDNLSGGSLFVGQRGGSLFGGHNSGYRGQSQSGSSFGFSS